MTTPSPASIVPLGKIEVRRAEGQTTAMASVYDVHLLRLLAQAKAAS